MRIVKVYTVSCTTHPLYSGTHRFRVASRPLVSVMSFADSVPIDEAIDMEVKDYPVLKFSKVNEEGDVVDSWYSVHTDELKDVLAEVIMAEEGKLLDMQNRLEAIIGSHQKRLTSFNSLSYLSRIWACLRNLKV